MAKDARNLPSKEVLEASERASKCRHAWSEWISYRDGMWERTCRKCHTTQLESKTKGKPR